MKIHKKGQVLDNFGSLAIGVGALCITLVITFLIMAQANSNMRSDSSACINGTYVNSSLGCCTQTNLSQCAGVNLTGYSYAYNATGTLQNATATIPGWIPIVIITAIGALLISMVEMFKR